MKIVYAIAGFLAIAGCKSSATSYDASGNFEADEVIVSAESTGKLLSFIPEEGKNIAKDSVVGWVDALPLQLQQAQLKASMQALSQKTADVYPAIALLKEQKEVLLTQLANQQQEKQRIEKLLKADAATGKQLDDIQFQIALTQKQIAVNEAQLKVQVTNVQTQNRAILSETNPLEKQMKILDDKVQRTKILNPVAGTVLAKYAMQGEIVSVGKALYKIADISVLNCKAYITGSQLPGIQIGQKVTVFTDDGKGGFTPHEGLISWIADKAEFTPKTIQTKDERANLVYAIKIRVKNDGKLKIGMYAEVRL